MWFPATLLFGWYVTRVADYSMFYGSFAAGIATLVWLYITSLQRAAGRGIEWRAVSRPQERLVRECAAHHQYSIAASSL